MAKLARRILWYAVTTAIALVVLYPVVWLFLVTFKPSSDIIASPSLFSDSPTFDNYTKVFKGVAGIPLWRFALNSTLLSCATVLSTLISCSITAYAFARIRFKGRGIFFALMISTLLLPGHVIMIPQYILFQRLGLVDSYVPLLIGDFLATSAFFVFLLVQFLRSIPRELDEAARLDGCGHPRTFFWIILPLLKPALVAAGIFSFLRTWNEFLGPLLYINTPEKYPLPLALRLFVDQTGTSDFGAELAMSVVALVPVLLFFLIFQRYILDGIATQGSKG
jgi:multiple sugar transport system permease protein